MIVETSEDQTRALVRFGARSWSGEGFGGTCLYAYREGRWEAYRIRPSESRDIGSAEAWLAKRKWKQWRLVNGLIGRTGSEGTHGEEEGREEGDQI